MLFSLKKKEPVVIEDTSSKDLALINQLNQELAKSIELKETLENALEVIIKRINAQAANVFMIEEKKQVFQCPVAWCERAGLSSVRTYQETFKSLALEALN